MIHKRVVYEKDFNEILGNIFFISRRNIERLNIIFIFPDNNTGR